MMRFFAKKIAAVQLAMMGKLRSERMRFHLPLRWKDVPPEVKRDATKFRDDSPVNVYKEERIVVAFNDGTVKTYLLDDVSGEYSCVSERRENGSGQGCVVNG